MTPETINAWFTPFHYFVYLGTIFIVMVVYYMWKWAKTCKMNIQILVVQQGGGGDFQLAPKAGGSVSIKNPHTNSTRTWPVNELTTIDVLYPGVGFVPAFLQKTIRLAIVHEGDWEPLLNRSPHLRKVASPDMVMALENIAEGAQTATKAQITELLKGVSTSPTREMIASPAVLGNLMQERISEIVATVAKDVFDPLREVLKKLGKPLNPTIVYIVLGLTTILVVYLVFMVNALKGVEDLSGLMSDIALIKQSLGVQ